MAATMGDNTLCYNVTALNRFIAKQEHEVILVIDILWNWQIFKNKTSVYPRP